MNRVPMVVVLGATGSGKSKLAIELALKYNGEIISADSMQVYKKLDIITNKVTEEERNLVPHHIIDFLNPLKRYSVVEFRNHALRTIDEILERNKIPVIVGGTNYYIEALLWKILVESDNVDVQMASESKVTGVSDQDPPKSSLTAPNACVSEPIEEAANDVTPNSSQSEPFKQMKTESDNFRENLSATLFYCQSIFRYVQDSLIAPVSTIFECIEPVYRIQPQVSPDELRNYETNIFNKMFGQIDAIENIKRHKNTIQLSIKIIEELFILIFNLKKLAHLARGTVSCDVEPRTYVKNVLLPNLISTNIFVLNNFISALFPDMSQLRAEINELLDEIDKISSDSDVLVCDIAKRDFLSQVETCSKSSNEKLGTLVGQLKKVVAIEEACLKHLPSSVIHERLGAVDPARASALHPNDRRKVFRSLQVYLKTAKTHSELLRKQKSESGASDLGGPLRFPNTCVFWIQTDQDTLDARLDKRVDDMISNGLIQELTDFHDEYNASRLKDDEAPDYTKGIFQSIGFKEFHSYLILSEEERQTKKGLEALQAGVESLKVVTRRYSRTQIKWLKNRFFRTKDRQVPPVYKVDSSNVAEWDEEVLKPASEVVKYLLEGGLDGLSQCPIKPIPKETDYPQQERHKDFYCEICERLFIGTLQWESHLTSKRHAKVVQKKKKEAAALERKTEKMD